MKKLNSLKILLTKKSTQTLKKWFNRKIVIIKNKKLLVIKKARINLNKV